MSEKVRSLIVSLREFIGTRRRAPRRQVRLDVTLGVRRAGEAGARTSEMRCYTHDLSRDGIGLVVPVIRVGDVYLAGADVRLRLALDLPDGTSLRLVAAPVRYHRLDGEGEADAGYLIGARLVEIGDADRARLDALLERLRAGAHERRQARETPARDAPPEPLKQ